MSNKQPTVVVIGVFDGVHAGHRYLLANAKHLANERDARLVVASFDPHPASILRPDDFLGLLTLPKRRTQLLRDQGVDAVEYLQFDEDFRTLTPDEFVEQVIVDQLGASTVVVGRNFRFGYKAAGDTEVLQSLASKYGIEVHVLELKGDTSTWSSSRIRKHIIEGEVEQAHAILGRLHRLTGVVVHGDHRGRELGFPTANLEVEKPLVIPADGVYSGLLIAGDVSYPAAISIGTNPTFDDVFERRVEAYVLDKTDLDLYGQRVDVDFIARIRGMQAFSSIDELMTAMHQDVAVSRAQIDDFLETQGH